ncbi:Retinol dehydrogenase 11 [Auxenochlorella protothecoides]|uniref:Retinol dehydrogenase 11 n=2 Tax=Auxenochlorella protothecoides TaxID=3075 RepID=A0A087SC75_AUXPR|nr:Retinol dehydrogenase 11 [Auxenochlorella protothecoides]KFM23329.1 Retinol dehydrogenase 11 [Auxenochlorella protothecoides]
MRSIPDLGDIGESLAGATVLVTGPTGGIGQQSATEFARRGANGEELKKELEGAAAAEGRAVPNLEVMELDVSSLASVRKFGEAWESLGRPLHVLVNNAGIFSMSAPYKLTSEGFESHLATNYLGHFLLTMLLLPALKRGCTQRGAPSRVVHVSSKLHYMGSVLFSTELDARAGPSVRSVAVHPGEVLTNVIHTLPGPVRWLYARLLAGVLLTPRQGARSTVHAATSPRVLAEEAAAPYLHSDCAPVPPSPAARDAELARWAWAWSVDAAGLASDRDLAPVAGGGAP